MSRANGAPVLMALAAVFFAAPGCGKQTASEDPETLNRRNELGEVFDMYTQFIKEHQRPPKQPADLLTPAAEQQHPAGYRTLKDGTYAAVWGVDVSQNPGAVLAYEKDAPKQGGAVLLADGTVKKMTADELRAALTPGK